METEGGITIRFIYLVDAKANVIGESEEHKIIDSKYLFQILTLVMKDETGVYYSNFA